MYTCAWKWAGRQFNCRFCITKSLNVCSSCGDHPGWELLWNQNPLFNQSTRNGALMHLATHVTVNGLLI
jgi:hypothetical protein